MQVSWIQELGSGKIIQPAKCYPHSPPTIIKKNQKNRGFVELFSQPSVTKKQKQNSGLVELFSQPSNRKLGPGGIVRSQLHVIETVAVTPTCHRYRNSGPMRLASNAGVTGHICRCHRPAMQVSQASHAGVTGAGPRVRWQCPSVQLSGIHELGSCGTVQPVAMLVHVYSLSFLHHTQHPVHVGPTCVGHTHTQTNTRAHTHAHAHTHARTYTHAHTHTR